MSNQLAKFDPGKLAIFGDKPVNDKFTAGIKGGEYLPKISIKGREFATVISGERKQLPREVRYELPVVIVDARESVSKEYYKKKWGERDGGDEVSAPDCQSLDGVSPDRGVAVPVNPTCQLCPFNAWGSADTGKGKRCSDYKLLIVVPANKLDAQPFQIRLPATSLKSFKSYCRSLDTHGIPVNGAITVLSFKDAEHPQLEFTFEGTLGSREDYDKILAAAERQDVRDTLQSEVMRHTDEHPAQQPVTVQIQREAEQPQDTSGWTTPTKTVESEIVNEPGPKAKRTRKPKAEAPIDPPENTGGGEKAAAPEDAGSKAELDDIINAWTKA
jgi:hypothetical protein